jgi:hypothetical protein
MELGSHLKTKTVRSLVHIVEFAFLFIAVIALLTNYYTPTAQALSLGQRRVTLIDNEPSLTTTYEFYFDIMTVTSIGSMEFEFCTNNPLSGTPCTAPAGFNALGTSLAAEAGETGFSISGVSTSNRIVIGRVPAITSVGTKFYEFTNIVNPSTPNQTVFVRISTYPTSDGTGPFTDNGGVAFSTSETLTVNAYVPPFLILCVGVVVQPSCSTVTGSNINLGELNRNSPTTATSQYGVATNDPLGYQTYSFGNTMTSGNNVIPQLATQTPSTPGSSQYGINIRANTNPLVGQNPAGAGSGVLSTQYDDSNLFKFQNGDLLASSTVSTDFNTYTISHLVNVSAAQPPGRYSTTLTVVGIASF